MPSDFTVVAIVAAYNESDIIEPVVADLIAQGIQVYFLDDGSTDATAAIAERYVGRGVVRVERLRSPDGNGNAAEFDWERILLRKTALARELARMNLSQAIQKSLHVFIGLRRLAGMNAARERAA